MVGKIIGIILAASVAIFIIYMILDAIIAYLKHIGKIK